MKSKIDKVRSVIQSPYTDISEVDMTNNLFFLNSEFDAFAKKDRSLNSTLKIKYLKNCLMKNILVTGGMGLYMFASAEFPTKKIIT